MQAVSNALQNALDAGNPQRVLLVFNDGEFTNEDIAMGRGIELNEEFNSDEDITIGATPSSVITFTLLNDNYQLDDFEFGWFTAYLGARIDSGTPTEITRMYTERGSTAVYAFAPIGTFYANKPKIIRKKTVSVTAFDRMATLDVDMPDASTLGISYPTTIGAIYQAICNYCGISYESGTFLNSTLEVPAEPKDMRMASIRQVIGWIAECACSIARINRKGKMEFAWFNSTELEYDEHDYSEFSPAWYETHSINGLYYRDIENSTEDTQGVTLTNNYLIQDNPFLRG